MSGSFPRLSNRGLIEAASVAGTHTHPKHFRGYPTAALLKRSLLESVRRPVPALFPRLSNRGLIEAYPAVPDSRLVVEFPRLSNRGLIEAATGLPLRRPPSNFRGYPTAALLKHAFPGTRQRHYR